MVDPLLLAPASSPEIVASGPGGFGYDSTAKGKLQKKDRL